MTSANYSITQDSVNYGGSEDGQSQNYQLTDTGGELDSGPGDSDYYSIEAGFRQNIPDTPYLTFKIAAASSSTQVAYTALSIVGSSSFVTVVDETKFQIGDAIAVVENLGASQKVTIGRVKKIVGSDLKVDFWTGDQATMSLTPVGGDDFVYLLSGSDIDLGGLSFLAVKTGISYVEITVSSPTGYTISVAANHNFEPYPGAGLMPVSDGAVILGAGEYGAESIGPYALGVNDWAISTASTPFAQFSGSWADKQRTGTVYKAASAVNSAGGVYTQGVYYYATANF
jgi:hypothetical protein